MTIDELRVIDKLMMTVAENARLWCQGEALQAENDTLKAELSAATARVATFDADLRSLQASRDAALKERDAARRLYSPVVAVAEEAVAKGEYSRVRIGGTAPAPQNGDEPAVKNHGPCGYCGKDVIEAYPWYNGGPKKPGSRPYHEDCFWKKDAEAVDETALADLRRRVAAIETRLEISRAQWERLLRPGSRV